MGSEMCIRDRKERRRMSQDPFYQDSLHVMVEQLSSWSLEDDEAAVHDGTGSNTTKSNVGVQALVSEVNKLRKKDPGQRQEIARLRHAKKQSPKKGGKAPIERELC